MNVRRDSIEWAVLHQAADYVRVGVILPDRIQWWDQAGAALSSRLQAWLDGAPVEDPLGPVTNQFFDITDCAEELIPENLRF